MARVRDVEIDEVPADARPVYERYARDYGPFLNQVKVFAHRPAAVRHIMGLLLEMADDPIVDKRYLEIGLVTVSAINKCEYCVTHHAPRLMQFGISRDAVDAILEDEIPGFEPLDYLVRDYAKQVTEDHNRVRDTMFDKLREHFSEEQIVELTLRIALCTFFNKFNDVLQIDIEDDARSGMIAAE